MPGFVEFHLFKGPEAEDHTLYASHTVWENRAVFEVWTKSEAFRAAHSRAAETSRSILAPSTLPANAFDLPIERYVVGMARRPAAVDVRYRRVLCGVAFIAMMRYLPGKDGRGSNDHDQDRN